MFSCKRKDRWWVTNFSLVVVALLYNVWGFFLHLFQSVLEEMTNSLWHRGISKSPQSRGASLPGGGQRRTWISLYSVGQHRHWMKMLLHLVQQQSFRRLWLGESRGELLPGLCQGMAQVNQQRESICWARDILVLCQLPPPSLNGLICFFNLIFSSTKPSLFEISLYQLVFCSIFQKPVTPFITF